MPEKYSSVSHLTTPVFITRYRRYERIPTIAEVPKGRKAPHHAAARKEAIRNGPSILDKGRLSFDDKCMAKIPPAQIPRAHRPD